MTFVTDKLNAITLRLEEINTKVELMFNAQATDHWLVSEHDKLLVRGTETTFPIQETLRRIEKEQTDFIEMLKMERKSAKETAEKNEKTAKEEISRWKWTLIGLACVVFPKIIWEALVFYITVVVPGKNGP